MVTDDEWVRSAMSDDRMVAELLLRLKYNHSPSPSLSSSSASLVRMTSSSLPPPRWGIRLPRSRMAFRFDAAASSSPEKMMPDFARNSPTTPLAWSTGGGGRGGGGASSSGTTNGSDESALPVYRPSDSRSKVVCKDDPSNSDAKRSKRKKTFAELREKEASLLKERLHLKKEIVTLRTTFKEHTARNEDLKKMKLDLDLNATNGPIMAPNKKGGKASALEKNYTVQIRRTPPTSQKARWTVCSSPCQAPVPVEEPDGGFLLPDLNMTPSESDFPTEIQVAAS